MIDSHAHVAHQQFDEDRDEVVVRMREAGVTAWVEIGTDLEESRKAIDIAEKYDVWATVGVHPSDIDSLNDSVWQNIEKMLQHPKVRAVGEVGLDLYRGGDLKAQKKVLQRFIGLAQGHNLPLVFHVRSSEDIDLHEELIDLLTSLHSQDVRGVLHTFSGTVDQARQYVDLGMHISFSGVVTFKNAQETQAVAQAVPINRILIETDCPFLAPDPYRGQRNEPAYVGLVAEKIANLRGISISEVKSTTFENTKRLFNL